MKSGDTFILPKSAEAHTWFVISDTANHPDTVLCVNVTSKDRFSDTACVLNAGDHPIVKHPSSINYDRAKIATLEEWDKLEKAGFIKLLQPVSREVLQEIRDGAGRSARISNGDLQILQEQGVLTRREEDDSSDPM